ncbi:hypothetical protein H4R19_004238, partial [Coemansia spiralis]
MQIATGGSNPASPQASSRSPSLDPVAGHPVARTPSGVDFPGAFSVVPRSSAKSTLSLGRIMKGGVAGTVSDGLANVVGGVYSIVNYVNPLAARPAVARGPSTANDSPDGNSSERGGDITPSSGSGDGRAKPGSPLLLQPASAGTSVAADLDERCLADANADNPENNRPPTPTKTSFTRMLRLPTHTVGDPSLHASSAEYKQAVQNDPVSRNVAQRTGRRFRPGAEEKRRYMRRMSKAPQLIAQAPDGQDDSDDETA